MNLIEFQLKLCPKECQQLPDIKIDYGTSGFRYEAQHMPAIVYRVGILAAIRSKHVHKSIGVIVTASHNPAKDNGVKIIDDDGGMLCEEWETYANNICNTKYEDLYEYIENISRQYSISLTQSPASVFVAQDTRKSGEELLEFLISGTTVFPYTYYYNFGKTTTPILHFLVFKSNKENCIAKESSYFDHMFESYKFYQQRGLKLDSSSLLVDCANGIGALKMEELIGRISDLKYVELRNVNVNDYGELNHLCGADYVKQNRLPPLDFNFSDADRCVSFDGDADRIVYFFSRNSEFQLLDGDYIAVLFIYYISHHLSNFNHSLSLGYVYAAYSNSAATKYAQSKLVKTVCTKTGVKYLHSTAKTFDIGIYFESNGHGTVLFSSRSFEILTSVTIECKSAYNSAQRLLALNNIINQTNGDAISVLFAVEIILCELKMTFGEWHNLMKPLPYSQLKLKSDKKDIILTSPDEQFVVHPDTLRIDIDEVLKGYPNSRAFISRPSGTENVVRIFAEAPTQNDCDEICAKLHDLVLKYCPTNSTI